MIGERCPTALARRLNDGDARGLPEFIVFTCQKRSFWSN
jgi:hypothetical protein